MRRLAKIEPYVFFILLALLLVPVWAVDFFVTGDGPCHLYNSKILLDYWKGVHVGFYQPFYYPNYGFNPNWLFYLLTIPLLDIFGLVLTEKIFFSIYVLLFGLGFRFLIGEINSNARFLSSIGLLFCYHKLLMMGFLNNSLSFAIWFWVAALWWRHRNVFTLGAVLANAAMILLLYSAHPMGLIFCLVMIITMMLGMFFVEYRDEGWKNSWSLFLKRSQSLLISTLPVIILFAEFILRHTWTKGSNDTPLSETWKNIRTLTSLITLNSTERDLAKATAITCFVLFAIAILLRLRSRRWMPADGLLLFIAFVVYSILFPSTGMSGGLEVSLRMAVIPFVGLLCWTATAQFPVWTQLLAQITALVIGIGFLAARMPIYQQASDYAEEVYSCDLYLGDTSTLLVLNYDWRGLTPEGKPVANKIWLFPHVDCYLGVNRSAVISDNYEANFSYFPVTARWETNMYMQTNREDINFDHRPPRADIHSYYNRTHQQIDYVLMLSYREEFSGHPYTQEIFAQLDAAYEKIYTSAHQRAILYKRKS